jgi:predicted TPR repeat methyltransferase
MVWAFEEETETAFRTALSMNPRNERMHLDFANHLAARGDFAGSLQIYRSLLDIYPEHPIARHLVAAMSGEGWAPRAADDYVQRVFDGFAPHFDERLAQLDYRAPRLAADLVGRHGPAPASLEILDLGCGTGLCGPLLRSYARRLVGIDLSPGMLEKARERGAYDALEAAEITAYLAPLDGVFDLVVSTDVFCYFGDLTAALAGAAKALRRGGCLILTVEHLRGGEAGLEYRLEPYGRYSHADTYLRRLLPSVGLEIETLEEAMLRLERGAPVAGLLVGARKG